MKAVVMETRGKKAAILLKDGTFRVIKGTYTVGETIDFREKARPALRRLIAAAAAVAILGTGGWMMYDANYVVYAEVSLDVNPSVVYAVNKQSRVLGIRAINDAAAEAVRILEENDVRFKPVSEAIEKTMAIFESEGYLDSKQKDYVLVNVSADDKRLQGNLSKEVENGIDHAKETDPTMEYRIDHSDRETARRAAEKNMSPGRYAIWEQKGDGSRPEEYAEKPVREMLTENLSDTAAAQRTGSGDNITENAGAKDVTAQAGTKQVETTEAQPEASRQKQTAGNEEQPTQANDRAAKPHLQSLVPTHKWL